MRMCIICNVVSLTGKQTKYCSKQCERKGWRDANKDKLLVSKRHYRQLNKDKIAAYNSRYKKLVRQAKPQLVRDLINKYRCLRCMTNKRLEVHHIKHQVIGGGSNDLNNLVVLCKPCHALWHKMFPKEYWQFGLQGVLADRMTNEFRTILMSEKPIGIERNISDVDLDPEQEIWYHNEKE